MQLAAAATPPKTTCSRVEQLASPAATALPRLHQLLCQADPSFRYLVRDRESVLRPPGMFGVPIGFGWDLYRKPGARSNPESGYGTMGPFYWTGN